MSANVIAELFSGLVRRDNQANVVPDVAREVPTVANGGITPDGKTITFSIREGAAWSDGRPVVADDFVYSFKRQLDPRVGSARAANFLDIAGAQAYATALGTRDQPQPADDRTLAQLADSVGVRATSPSTLVVELVRPALQFLERLATRNNSFATRRDVVEAHGDRWTEAGNLIGNGPFVLSDWVHNSYLALVPNPLYHGEKPRITKLTFSILDPGAAWRGYQSRKVDLAPVPPGSRALVLSDPTLASQVIRQSLLATTYLRLNVTRPPFDNPRVRRAVARAVDRRGLVDALEGVGMPATSALAPGVPGHDPELGKEVQGFDPVEARRLLAEAGFAGGTGFPGFAVIATFAEGPEATMLKFVKGELRANLGIEMTVEPLGEALVQRRLESGDFQAGVRGSNNLLTTEAHLQAYVSGNIGRYSNPAFDLAVFSARDELDPAKQMALWQQAHQILVEDSPAIFLYYPEELWLRQPSVRGLTQCYVGNIPGAGCFSQVWIDKG